MSRLPGVVKGPSAGRVTFKYVLAVALGLFVGLAVNFYRRPPTAGAAFGSAAVPGNTAAGEYTGDAVPVQTAATPTAAASAASAAADRSMLDVAGALLLQNAWRASSGGSSDDTGAASAASAGETVINAATIDKLNRLHTMRDEVLDVLQMNSGISHQGSLARPRRFMHKLMAGEPLHFALTGGSVSTGLGEDNYARVAYRRLTEAFPHKGHRNHSGAVPGIMSSYINACMKWHVPEDADLILVEFNVNDGFEPAIDVTYGGLDHPRRRPFERLLRKLLRLPNQPAVILVHAFDYSRRLFMSSGEDQMGVFAQLYEIPTVSLRNVIWKKAQRNETGYKVEELMLEGGGDMHPNARGHLMMADMVTGFLRRVGEGLLLRPYSPADQAAVDEALPEPVLPGNEALSADNCIIDVKFKDLCAEHPGFEWTDEGRNKWGYVATEPESKLVWTVDTRTAAPADFDNPHTVVTVNHLRSYEHMGQAEITCLSGCSCEASVMDSHWEEKHSQLALHQLSVSQAESCQMQLRVMAETKSKEHKVKVQGIVVADIPTRPGDLGGFMDRPYILEPWQLGASVTDDVCDSVMKARKEGSSLDHPQPHEIEFCITNWGRK